MLAYLRAVSSGALRRRWLGASVAALACALASKAMAMTLPLTLLVINVYPLRRRDRGWLALVREKLPHFVLAALAALVATWAVTRGAAWTSYETYGLPARLALTAYSFWFHATKLVWPEELSPLYEMPRASISSTRASWGRAPASSRSPPSSSPCAAASPRASPRGRTPSWCSPP